MAEPTSPGGAPVHPGRRPLQRALDGVTPAAGAFVLVVATMTLVGWLLESELLLRIVSDPTAGVMMPNTAIGLLLAGGALCLLRSAAADSPRARMLGRLMALLATALGLLVLLEYLAGIDFGIDRILFEEKVRRLVPINPGRPAPTTAVSFAVTGAALLLLDRELRGGLRPAQLLALIPGFLAIQGLTVYGYRQEALLSSGPEAPGVLTPMALHTAACFIALVLGILFARPDRGFASIFSGDDIGAFIARRLLPAAILVPLLLGWLRLAGEGAGLFGPATGVALFAVATMVAFTLLIGWNAAVLRRLDMARARAEDALRGSERRYRTLVETAYEGVWVIDTAGRTTFVNQRMSEMLGYAVEEMEGRPVFDFMEGRDRPIAERQLARRRAGVREVHEFPLRHRNGSPVWVLMSTSPLEDEHGGYAGALAMATDITERKRSVDETRESEARFRSIFERAGIGIVLADAEGRFLMTNPVMQRFLGYTAEELQGMRFTEITHPEDVDIDWSLFQELLSGTRDVYQIEKRYLTKAGHIVWGRLTGSLVRDASGGYANAIGMVEDITARKELEEERSRLTAVLEATPDFVGTADADGRVKSLNRAAREMVGIGLDEEVHSYRIADLHPPRALTEILGVGIPTAIREGVWTGETAVLTRDGREIRVSQVILAHRDASGRVAFLSTVLRDLSERIRREEDEGFLLEASSVLTASLEEEEIVEEICRLLATRRADFSIVHRLDGNGQHHRPASAAHRRAAEQPLVEELAKYGSVGGRAGVSAVLETGSPELVVEVTGAWLSAVATSDAHLALLRRLDVRSEIAVAIRAHGRTIGAITLGRTGESASFTETDLALVEELASRIAVAIENCRLYVESREATRTRDEVLRIVAHDLRNPLSTISLATGSVLRLLPESMSTERRQLQIVERSVQLSNRLIQDLLDVARMQAGRLTIEAGPIAARELAAEAVELHRDQASAASIELTAELPGELPRLFADHDRLLQVFANLIGNALKFTPEGGRITVRARLEDGAVRYSVRDTGPGISEEDQKHLFDPFWQARPGMMGAGLGLALARGIVEAHGGTMEVRSRMGEGSTFSFTIPLAAPPAPAPD